LAVLLCFAKIFRDICVENYKEFNGVNFSSTKARMYVLASFESWIELAIAIDLVIMNECQEVSNTALHNFPRPQALKEEIGNRTRIKGKSLNPAGFEPTTSGLDHR